MCFTLAVKSQNIVPNGSFESYTVCPTAAQFYNLSPWCGLGGGEDSYNKCFSDLYGPGGLGIPETTIGFQYPRTGNGMGSVILRVVASGTNNAERREYLHAPLNSTLQAGKVYCGTMYVNLINPDKFTTDRIGMALTSNSYACNQAMPSPQTIAPLNIVPQVANPTGNFIVDTLNWVEVSNTFTVTGNEAYLTIGNFYDDVNSSFYNFNPAANYYVILFFVDDVSIEEVHPAKAKNDTTIMFSDSTVIGNNLSEATLYSWQPTVGLSCANCANPKASPTVTTTYTVTKTQCKAITTDVITVSVDHVGITELNIDKVTQLQPNPTSGILNINSRFEMERVEVFDVAGQVMLSEQIHQTNYQTNLSNFSEGIYFVKIIYPNEMSVVKKVIVNR